MNKIIPTKFIRIERNDHFKTSWNECPNCKTSIGYHPDKKDFRCPKCGQRISWK